MLFRGGDPRLAALAGVAAQHAPAMVDETVAAIVAEMGVYGDEQYVSLAELRCSVADNLDVAVRTLQGAVTPDLSQATTTGRVRALQGSPLPELVRAYRIGLTVVWRCIVDQLSDHDPGDLAAVVGATTAIWALADDYADAVTAAYRDASTELVIAQQTRRSALVEALFAGGEATEGILWDVAAALGLSVEGDFVVVAAESPVLGREPLPAVEARLRERHHASAWRLTPDLQAGVVSLRHPEAAQAVLALVAQAPDARVGLSPVFAGLASTSRALHLARVALSSLAPGASGAVQFTESPLAGLVASSPEAAVQLAQQVLGPVLGLPGEEATVLLLTLRSWFASQGSTNLTAERMFCHPNTIRLRLRRIAEELGRPLSDPEHVAEVGAALRALQLFPGGDHLHPGGPR